MYIFMNSKLLNLPNNETIAQAAYQNLSARAGRYIGI